MVSISPGTNTNAALMILRQDNAGERNFANSAQDSAVDKVDKIINARPIAQITVSTPKSVDQIPKPQHPDFIAHDKKDLLIHYVAPGRNEFKQYTEDTAFWTSPKILKKMIGYGGTSPSQLNYQSKVVEATTMAAASNSALWDASINDAIDRFGQVLSTVIRANSGLHPLNHVEANRDGADFDAVTSANWEIDFANRWQKDDSAYAANEIECGFDRIGMNGTITKNDAGEYAMSAFQMRTDNGKLVAELRDNGHFVTYNEDCSVERERDRAEICLEISSSCLYAKMAYVLYSEDKDLQLY